MALLDTLIENINDDLRDCISPVRDRFRFALSSIFDYSVANPSQNNVVTAQSDIHAIFIATYPDALISPGIDIDTFLQAFVNRHGVGATITDRWISVRDFIVARAVMKSIILTKYESGNMPVLEELWFYRIAGSDEEDLPSVGDFMYTEIRETTPGPTFNFIIEKQWSSVSLGKTVRRVFSNFFDGKRVIPSEGPLEII